MELLYRVHGSVHSTSVKSLNYQIARKTQSLSTWGKKRGGNIIINYFWRALLTPLVPGNVQKKVIDSRISIPHLHMHVWPIQIKGAPN